MTEETIEPPQDGRGFHGPGIVALPTTPQPAEEEVEAWAFSDPLNDPEPPKREWLIPAWLPADRVSLLAGAGGMGKSRLVWQVAAALVAGVSDWLPGGSAEYRLSGAPCPVLYASYEDEAHEFRRRRPAFIDRGKPPSARLVLAEGSASLWSNESETDAADKIQSMASEIGARLLVIDPVAAAYTDNENDRGQVRAFMGSWDRWAKANQCAVLFLSHPPKNSDADWSGSTDWQAAARVVWTLSECSQADDGTPIRKPNSGTKTKTAPCLQCIKSSYGPRPWPQWLESQWPMWVFSASPMPTLTQTKGKADDGLKTNTNQGGEHENWA